MKTVEFPDAQITVAFLQSRVSEGDVLHGSPRLDLDELRPAVSNFIFFHDDTGERAEVVSRLSATEDVDLAIFYGAVHKVCKDAGLHRATGVQSIRDHLGKVIGHRYFVSDRAKQLLKDRHEQGIRSAVYHSPRHHFSFWEREDEWQTDRCVDEIGSVAVSIDCLSFDVFSLLSPDSDPMIHHFLELHGAPPETPPLLSQAVPAGLF